MRAYYVYKYSLISCVCVGMCVCVCMCMCMCMLYVMCPISYSLIYRVQKHVTRRKKVKSSRSNISGSSLADSQSGRNWSTSSPDFQYNTSLSPKASVEHLLLAAGLQVGETLLIDKLLHFIATIIESSIYVVSKILIC